MVNIHNSEIIKELREGSKVTSNENVPNQLADKVVPVMEVNPKLLRRINKIVQITNSVAGTTQSSALLTNQDFFLVAISASYYNDAASTATNAGFQIQDENGAVLNPHTFYTPVATLQTQNMSLSFPCPIKLKRGSNLQAVISGVNVGVHILKCNFFGYYVENTLA